jgi:hypothetical protein
MSIELEDKEPVFGAFWFTAKVDTDRDAGTAVVRDVKVTRVRWPDSTEQGQAHFTQLVEEAMPKTGFEISLEQLSASLATAERETKSMAALKNDPPSIVFKEQLAVLLLYDGQPRFTAIEGTNYERAMNTPFAVARDKKSHRVYLTSGAVWYEADNPLGPFAVTRSPPADLVKSMPASEDAPPQAPPIIVVATQPTELVSTNGKPSWKALPGGKLLYVDNTETAWIRDLADQQMYVLLSGRWFRAKQESGPWSFVRADQLPASFKEIPPDSDIGGLRVSVAGTPEAQEAVLDAQIPQTAAIKRNEATLDVKYDGAPKFEKIAGTNVTYAVNTSAQVLEISTRYYAVDNGVWFTASAPTGPWVVADEVPEDEIKKIPPSAPVYNTTYVHIYESTPEVVYVGYYPGYLWSFPYYGVPVYGTGFYYPPYYGAFYYPRPPTWGFHVGYNPWTGWNFGVSWSNGFFSMGVSWGAGWGGAYRPAACCGGWYGGGYHRGTTVINTGDIRIGNSVSVGNRANVNNRLNTGSNIDRNRYAQSNLYNRTENRTRVADRATASRDLQQARAATGRSNDVFAVHNGNVARRSGNQWETRDAGRWEPTAAEVQNATRERAQQGVDRASSDRSNMDRPDMNRPDAERTNIDRSNIDRPNMDRPDMDRPNMDRPDMNRSNANRPNIDRGELNRAHAARSAGAARYASRGGGRRR